MTKQKQKVKSEKKILKIFGNRRTGADFSLPTGANNETHAHNQSEMKSFPKQKNK